MQIKEEYYRKIEDFCDKVEIEVPDRKDIEALQKIMERMKRMGVL